MLRTILTDRRLWLLGSIFALVVIVCRWVMPAHEGFQFVINGGYWITLGLVVMFFRSLFPLLAEKWRGTPYKSWEWGAVAAAVLVVVVWTAHEKPGYKVLADELLLSGTSMGMHFERQAAYPTRATDIQGAFQILSSVLDKRPLLFPFLTATVHDFTGYRPENAFYLNMALGVVFLVLVYVLGWKIAASRWGGIVAVLLFAGLPLLAQQATGGGFELLNLVLIAVLALLMAAYLKAPVETGRLEAMVYAALLLAYTRYESVIFLMFAAVVAVAGWVRSGRVVLTWPLIFSPLWLVQVLIQNRVFTANTSLWEMQSVAGSTEPFGWRYLSSNLGHALAFFFDFSGYQPNSALLAALGLLSLPFAVLWVAKVLRAPRQGDGGNLAWAVMVLALMTVTAVYLFYFWGQFDHPVIRRLSLPLHLLMVMAIVLVAAQLIRKTRGWQVLAFVALGGLLFQGLPAMARQAYRTSYSPGVEMQIRGAFLDALDDRNVLFLDNDSFYWIVRQIPASPIKQAQLRKDGLIFHLRNHSFQSMYVFQSVQVNDQTGERTVDPEDDLGPDFVLEPVLEQRVQTLLFARISRVQAIKEDGKVAAERKPFVEPLKERRTPEQLEEGRTLYLKNWIKMLP